MSLSDISKFFTTDVLDEIIKKVGGTNHISYAFGASFNKGDSYLSQVFRLKITGIDNNTGKAIEVNAIVKSMPPNLCWRKLFRTAEFFRNEINFYTKVIPVFEQFQSKRKPKQPFNEYPQHYASFCDGENDFIALEDISVPGYGPPPRQDTVDAEHCRMIMYGLGRLHAISLAIKDQEPESFQKLVENLEETYYREDLREWYSPFLKDAIIVANDTVSREYPGTVYEEKTKKFTSNDVYGSQIRLVNIRNEISVIGHGDCWTPNFLLRYENTTPKHMKIIDFQLARYGSPVLDISFFMYSCTNNQMREKHYNEMLKVYHKAASDLIEDLGSKPEEIFPYSALESELLEVARFGCGMGMESVPLSMKTDDEVADKDTLTGDNLILTDAWKIEPLPNKDHRLRFADIFKHAVDMGYLD